MGLPSGAVGRDVDRFPNARQADREWWSELWPDPGSVLADLGLDADESVADVGCGDGYLTLAIAETVAPAPVYAVAVDGTLLDEVEVGALERGIENVTTISGDARSLASLLPDPVDVVLVANTFHGVEAPAALAEQVSRSLSPGGRFVVVNWHDVPPEETTVLGEPGGPPAARRMTMEETRSVGKTAGFRAIEEVDLPPYHYGIVFKREHDR